MRKTIVPLVLLALLLAAVPARSGDKEDPLTRAGRLRDETGPDWKAGRYAEAAAKLREADAIYAAAKGDHLVDRVVVNRALCFNEWKAGQGDAARATWIRLVDLASGNRRFDGEVRSAYSAVYGVAEKVDDPAKWYEPVLEIARKRGYEGIVGQVLHDLGYIYFERKTVDRAEKYYLDAIRLRTKIDDRTGLAWSRVNLVDLRLSGDRLKEALPPLLDALLAIRDGSSPLAAPQAALAINLNKALGMIGDGSASDPKLRAWLWAAADGAATAAPEIVPADYLYRRALALDPGVEAAGRLASVRLPGRPAEVIADLRIRAARAAIAAGAAARAVPWLEGLAPGSGPAAPHLLARRDTVRALAAAALHDKARFPAEAKVAADRWRDLGDFAGRRGALGELAAAAGDLGLTDSLPDLVDEARKLKDAEEPRGGGASASATGSPGPQQNLGPHDPMFAVELADGGIRVTDLLNHDEKKLPVEWKPRRLALNGLNLTVFGGYVSIGSLAYGRVAITTSPPGTMTLDELGEYRVVPATGRLVILKDGATRYE